MPADSKECSENCRCCRNPSSRFVQIISNANIEGTKDKTYYEVLQEITCGVIPTEEDMGLPQMICRKCVKQLNSAYNFILQVQSTYEYYKSIPTEADDDTKGFEQLHETLIEFPVANSNGVSQFDVKEDVEDDNDGEKYKIQNCLDEEIDDTLLDEGVLDDTAGSGSDVYDIESIDDNDGLYDLNEPIACRCEVCHKVYRDERSLAIHKRFTHMPDDEKMACPMCSYKTSRSSALKVHMGLIHGSEVVEEHFRPNPSTNKKFPCNQCERGYQRREDLRKHIRKKHKPMQLDKQPKRRERPPKQKDELRFLCACCGQSYTSKKALDGHQLTHTGERPHECDICHKAFKRIKDMKAHRVIHSDEKPFQCSQCSKSFKRADKLKMHMRVHSELRPYKCTECDKTFKYPCVLRTHMYMHTGQTPFSCNTCGEAFSLRTSLNNHCLKNGHVK